MMRPYMVEHHPWLIKYIFSSSFNAASNFIPCCIGIIWAFQSASYAIRSIKTPWLSSFSRHHLILGSNLRLIFLNLLLIRISKTKSLYWVTTLSHGTILQSLQQHLSTFLVKIKSIWLAVDPLLKVIKWDSLFINQVFAKTNYRTKQKLESSYMVHFFSQN